MRPALLNPLFAPVTSLSGIGPKQDKLFRYLLDRSETPRLIDLLFHLPAAWSTGGRGRRFAMPCRDRRNPGSHHRSPSRRHLAVRTPFSRLCQRRHRRCYPDLFPRVSGASREAAASRLPALCVRYRADVLRHVADGASRPVIDEELCQPAADRAGLSVDRGLALGSLRRAVTQALSKLPHCPSGSQPKS